MKKYMKAKISIVCLCGIIVLICLLLMQMRRTQPEVVNPTADIGVAVEDSLLQPIASPGVGAAEQTDWTDKASVNQATNQHVYAKSGVSVGKDVLDIRYIEHEPPTLCRRSEPLSGAKPVWLKSAKILDESYKYEYSEIVDSMTKESLQMNGVTQESHSFMKQQYLDGAFDEFPELIERSLLSEMFVTVDGREFVVVDWDMYAWRKSIAGKASHGLAIEFYEKVDGLWKSTIDYPWYHALPNSRSELKDLLEGVE